jgi:hypothetical protein
MYDDQVTYFDGIVDFIRMVEREVAPSGRAADSAHLGRS